VTASQTFCLGGRVSLRGKLPSNKQVQPPRHPRNTLTYTAPPIAPLTRSHAPDLHCASAFRTAHGCPVTIWNLRTTPQWPTRAAPTSPCGGRIAASKRRRRYGSPCWTTSRAASGCRKRACWYSVGHACGRGTGAHANVTRRYTGNTERVPRVSSYRPYKQPEASGQGTEAANRKPVRAGVHVSGRARH
jgi:hypothetical protein